MRRFQQMVVASILLCLSGCATWDKKETAHIFIEENDFSPDQILVLQEAVSEWNQALNGYLNFEFVSNKDESNIVIKGVSLASLQEDDFAGVTYTVPWENGGNIELPNDLYGDGKEYLLPLALHELGHALSLGHSEEHTLMQPMLYNPTQRITCLDINQFCDINGCNAADFPICNPCTD